MRLLPSLQQVLPRLPDGWEKSRTGRIAVTRDSPEAFALVYLRHHLRGPETRESISYAECHADWYAHMREWMSPASRPREWRRVYIAPRSSAKTTHWFLFAPLWALAHGHASFVAAFADAASQAEAHLATFRAELSSNALLRSDFPDLCTPSGKFDNRTMYQSKSRAVFAARGIDASSLGMKMGERRPDVLIMDDVEAGGGTYSPWQAEQRRKTLVETILPLNEFARAVWVGTVTMPGSLVHQALKGEAWVGEEGFKVHHYRPFNEAGESIWPEKWPTEYLHSIQHHRSFALNFENDPVPDNGDYWTAGDIAHTPADRDAPRWLLSIDPAVTDKRTSDNSALAVLSQSASGHVQVRSARAVKATGRGLRATVEAVLAQYPAIRVALVEVNQGGDLWHDVFRGLPVKVRTTWSGEPKPVRAARLLEDYQTGRVSHASGWDDSAAVQELTAFPKAPHDDIVDAIGAGARYFLPAKSSSRFSVAAA